MGGGPSAAQNAAASSQANLTSQEAANGQQAQQFLEAQQNKVNPYYTARMNNGLPSFNAQTDAASNTTAAAYAPARAAMLRQLQGYGSALPSGFKTGAMNDLNESQAHAYDSSLQGLLGANDVAKQQGAQGLLGQAQLANPNAYYGTAMSGNSSIMNAPLQTSSPLGAILGGAAGGLASKIPF